MTTTADHASAVRQAAPRVVVPAQRPAPPAPSRRETRPPALDDRRRRTRLLVLPAALTAATGLSAVLGSAVPSALVDLVPLTSAPDDSSVRVARVVLVALGLALLLAARVLARGSQAAWTVAAAGSVGVLLAEVARERLGLSSVLAAVALLVLVLARPAFRLPAPDRRVRTVASALAAALLLTQLVLDPGLDGLRLALAAVALALLCTLRASSRRPLTGPARARALAERWGRSSAAPLVALPDNLRVPLCDGDAVAGLAVRNGVTVCLGLPVAPERQRRRALVEFVDVCERTGTTPALIALDEEQRALAAGEGFASVRIGEEAFLDVATFSTVGKRRSNVRHSVTRARKDGVVVVRYDSTTRTPDRDEQLAALSAAWLADKTGPELGFTLGRFDLDRLHDQEVYVALVEEGTPQERTVGFVTWLPYADGDAAVLDLMRRAEPCPPGVVECLVVDALADFAARGRRTVSLGGVPLAASAPRRDLLQRAFGWLYENGGQLYAAKGLFRFKDKFDPDWRPMYLAYPSATALPRVGLAVLRAFLPRGSVRSLFSRTPS